MLKQTDHCVSSPFVGCLTGPEATGVVQGTYTYRGRGVRSPLFPDSPPDAGGTDGDISLGEGSLWREGSRVGWRGMSLLDFGVDIKVEFGREVFLDRLVMRQDADAGSALAGIELLVPEDGGFQRCGRVDPPSSGMLQDKRLTVTAAVHASTVIIRLHACYRNLILTGLELYGAQTPGPVVYPIPADYQTRPGHGLRLDTIAAIAIADSASAASLFAAELLSGKIREDFGVTVPVATGLDAEGPVIAVGRPDELRGRAPAPDMAEDEYVTEVSSLGASVIATGRRGMIYGVETLLGLLRCADGVPALPPCRIADRPKMALRGVHFGLPPREEIPFVKRLVRHVFAPMRYNTVFLEFAGGMQYDRRPEINEKWLEANRKGESGEWPPMPHGSMVAGGGCLTKDEVRDLVAFMRAYGLEVIPEIQSLSHVQYLTITYPHLAEVEEAGHGAEEETDLVKADAKPTEFYPHCYCPSTEECYEVVFDLIDEITDVVQPEQFVHMGHDEVYVIGVCPKCKDEDPADLFATHVTRMHDYLQTKGYGMMIWSDMLQPSTRYKTPPAIARIPRDVVMLDFIWYFHFDRDLEDNLLKEGFRVAMGNMYSSHYPRFESRSVKPNMIGAEVSTWLRMDEYTLGMEGKIYDFLYSANMMWWPGYREELRWTWDRIICTMLPRLRERLHGTPYPSLAAKRSCTPITLPDVAGAENAGDLAFALPRDGSVYRGIPFVVGNGPVIVQGGRAAAREYPLTVEIAAGGSFESLVFLHGCSANAVRTPWKPLVRIAAYTVVFEDGTTEVVPVEYGGNIASANRRHALPMANPIYRHQGYIGTYLADPVVGAKTKHGDDVTLYAYEWLNPHSERRIKAVHLGATDESGDCAVMLLALTGIVASR